MFSSNSNNEWSGLRLYYTIFYHGKEVMAIVFAGGSTLWTTSYQIIHELCRWRAELHQLHYVFAIAVNPGLGGGNERCCPIRQFIT